VSDSLRERAEITVNPFIGSYTYPESGEVSYHIQGSPDDLILVVEKALSDIQSKTARECAAISRGKADNDFKCICGLRIAEAIKKKFNLSD